MHPKEFYKNYQADDSISELSEKLIVEILRLNPAHALDFGCGTGKHSKILHNNRVSTIALDISFLNMIKAKSKHELPCVVCADESYLRNLVNIDVVFTVSVLDHIEHIGRIIGEFKRIANKAVFLAETNDVPAEFYYPHQYESYGFEKLGYEWTGEDGAKYNIWKWVKGNPSDTQPAGY